MNTIRTEAFSKELLPATRPRCHSVNLLEYTDGHLFATWFAGSYEGAEDQVGMGAVMETNADEWKEPFVVTRLFEHDGDRWVTEQIVPIETADRETLFYTWAAPLSTFRMTNPSDPDKRGWRRRIPDGRPFRFRWRAGKAEEIECLAGVDGLPEQGIVWQGRPIQRDPRSGPGGGWVIPYHSEPEESALHSRSRVHIVEGDGVTCVPNKVDLHHEPGALEPALARVSNDRWLSFMRYARRGEGMVLRSESGDGCLSFSPPRLTNLRNNHSAVDICVGRSGRLLLAFNDSHTLRTPLTLGISEDEGETFRTQDVETERGEFSYPKLIQTHDGQWRLFYTWNRLHIAHVEFSEEWLLSGRRVIGM